MFIIDDDDDDDDDGAKCKRLPVMAEMQVTSNVMAST